MQRTIPRLPLCGLALLAAVLSPAAQAVLVQDVAGRSVKVPDKVERVLLGEGRLFYALSLLEGKKPFARVAGWQGDFKLLDPQSYALYRKQFPEIEQIPLIGKTQEATVSAEKVLTLKPDLAIFALSGHGPSLDNPIVQQLTSAGVAVIFVDFRDKPLQNTVPSLRAMGKALGRSQQAESFIRYYQGKLAAIQTRLAKLPAAQRPLVFTDMRAGMIDTLTTAGRGSFGELVEAAGGRNLGSTLLDRALGPVNVEHVLAQQPSHYFASGAAAPGDSAGVKLGAQVGRDEARASLQATGGREQLKGLPAARGAQTFAGWHQFYTMPQHIVLVEALAKWLHPREFKDIDPASSWAELHQRFGALTPAGTYWVSGQ